MNCHRLSLALVLILFLSPAVAADPTGLLAAYIVAPNGAEHRIDDFNSPLGGNRVVVYTPDFGPSTATVDALVEIVVVDGIVQEVLPLGYTNTPIPRNGYVISGRDTAATWLRSHLRPGQSVELVTDRLEADTVSASYPVYQVGPNVTRGADQLVIYTPGRERTGTNPWGLEAVVRDGIIVSVGGNDNLIPPDGFVLSGHGKARDWLAANARVGSAVDVAGGQVTIAFDSRSIARQATAYLAEAEERLRAAAREGVPLDYARVAEHSARAVELLAAAETLQSQGERTEAMRQAALAVGAAEKATFAALPPAPVGVRGVWYRPVEVTPEHVIATLNRLAKSGVNVVFLETFYRGRTLYPSQVAGQHSEFRRWDLLEVWIEEGRRRGIDIHLWIHVFRFDEYPSGTLLRAHPEWMASGPETSVPQHLRANNASADPAHSEVRAFVLALIEEMLSRYAPAGLHLDYIRYPKSDLQPSSFAVADVSRRLFMDEYGIDPLDSINRRGSPEWLAWEAWQEEQITSFVADVRALTRHLAPETILSAAVVGEIGEARSVMRQNWAHWAEEGYVDLLLPMLYNPDSEWVGRAVARAVELTGGKTLISAGIGVFLDFTPALVVDQLLHAEASGSLGGTHFALVHMGGAHFAALTEGLYASPAVPPYRTAEALEALGTTLIDSLNKTAGQHDLYAIGRALIASGSSGHPGLEEIVVLIDRAMGAAAEPNSVMTAWQARLLQQARRVAAAALHRLQSVPTVQPTEALPLPARPAPLLLL